MFWAKGIITQQKDDDLERYNRYLLITSTPPTLKFESELRQTSIDSQVACGHQAVRGRLARTEIATRYNLHRLVRIGKIDDND